MAGTLRSPGLSLCQTGDASREAGHEDDHGHQKQQARNTPPCLLAGVERGSVLAVP